MLISSDTNKSFRLDGDSLQTMTKYDFNVDHFNTQDQIIIYEFGKQMKFNIQQKERNNLRDESVIRLLKAPAVMGGSLKKKSSAKPKTQNLRESKTILISSNANELCDRLKLLLQEKQAGNSSKKISNRCII